ncbi:hypothetical protein [Terrabacter terrigena]|uniref:Uncharacterized protein n=1 Tax=Terrabacter terrigena TaxID=574718 RepID=A0ABW3MVT1_9MICO
MTVRAWVALAVTIVVELPVLVAAARLAGWVGWGRALAAGVGVNVLTQPLLYAVSTRFRSSLQLVAAEVVVVAVEATVLAWWWRVRAREETTTLALAVVAANALSTAAGLLVP